MAAGRVQEPSQPNQWMMLLCGSHSDRKPSRFIDYNTANKHPPNHHTPLQSYYYNFVMLSNYLRSGQAHFNPSLLKLSLSFTQKELHIDALEPRYRQAKILSLTHCGLKSLKGIEQFLQLQEVSVRCNCISEVEELLRITNKELILQLQFTGNDIEYLGGGLFINLQVHFPNLIDLNGKNYLSIIRKPSSKRQQMKKIMAQTHQMQKEMMRTVRKEERTMRALKMGNEECMRTEDNYNHTHPEQDQQEQLTSKSRDRVSSRQRSVQQQTPSPSRPSPSPHRNKENHNSSNHHDYDVSLGDISNIPMTKSVRGSFTPLNNANKHNKRKGLEIFTLNESHNRLPLSQPTATFAMQREKQNNDPAGIMFRNREKTQKYRPSALPIEECIKEEYERPTKRETYQSVSDEMNDSWSSSFSRDNIIHEDKTSNDLKKIQLAGALFTKNLLEKVFYSWQALPGEKNFPVKKQFV